MTAKFENVPYRAWGRDNKLGVTKHGKRVFDLAMNSHKSGKAVDMRMSLTGNNAPPRGARLDHPSRVYERISVTIED